MNTGLEKHRAGDRCLWTNKESPSKRVRKTMLETDACTPTSQYNPTSWRQKDECTKQIDARFEQYNSTFHATRAFVRAELVLLLVVDHVIVAVHPNRSTTPVFRPHSFAMVFVLSAHADFPCPPCVQTFSFAFGLLGRNTVPLKTGEEKAAPPKRRKQHRSKERWESSIVQKERGVNAAPSSGRTGSHHLTLLEFYLIL